MKINRLILFVAGLVLTIQARGAVTVSFSQPNPTFTIGQVFSVNLSANIPDPILGFGLDLKFDSTALLLTSFATGPAWFAAPGTEPDDVAGLAFPNPVSGSGVLLATLNFTALSTGSTGLIAAFDSSNLAEGFPLAAGGFADNNLVDELNQTGVPEPSTFWLMFGLCLIGSVWKVGGALLSAEAQHSQRRITAKKPIGRPYFESIVKIGRGSIHLVGECFDLKRGRLQVE